MSNHPSAASAAPAVTLSPANRARATLVAVILTLGALAVSAMLIWRPWGERNEFSYAELAPIRDNAWTGMVIDGLAIAAVGVTLGLAVCYLVPNQGASLANIGAVATGLGGIAFCAGATSRAVLAWYATATDAVPADVGQSLLAYIEDNPARVGILQISGFLLFTLGSLLLAMALWRAKAVPRWWPVVFAALTVALFAGLPGRVMDIVQTAQMASLVVVAWFLWRAASRR